VFQRIGSGAWTVTAYRRGGRVDLCTVRITIALDDLYAGIDPVAHGVTGAEHDVNDHDLMPRQFGTDLRTPGATGGYAAPGCSGTTLVVETIEGTSAKIGACSPWVRPNPRLGRGALGCIARRQGQRSPPSDAGGAGMARASHRLAGTPSVSGALVTGAPGKDASSRRRTFRTRSRRNASARGVSRRGLRRACCIDTECAHGISIFYFDGGGPNKVRCGSCKASADNWCFARSQLGSNSVLVRPAGL
jgi:hypothetical protein